MQLRASLSRDDVERLVESFVPFEVQLGDSRSFAIEEVTDVSLAPDAGVRVLCKAHFRWPIMGLTVPVRAKALAILFRPRIAIPAGVPSFLLTPSVEHIEIAWSPTAMDDGITERINRELAEHHIEVAWSFARTLSRVFRLPDAVKTAATFGIAVTDGRVTVTQESVEMAVFFAAEVGKRA